MTEELVRFLTETAHDAAVRAARAEMRPAFTNEVEELMALRARILARRQVAEQANQLQLPLEARAA